MHLSFLSVCVASSFRGGSAFLLPLVQAVFLLSVWGMAQQPSFADDYTGWRKKHPNWELVFSDDFKGRKLNTRKWNKIQYVSGKVADWRRYQSRDSELVTVNGNSTVTLWGKYGDYTSQADPEGREDTFACGGIFTDETFAFQYGYVEVRVKFTCAQGAWPAIWMMPVDGSRWPAKGEIDILEHLNSENLVYQTIHYNNASGKRTSRAVSPSAATFDSPRDRLAFHTYGVEWTPEGVTFYMDGKATGAFLTERDNPNWPFSMENNAFYLLLDMQLGGNWVGRIDRDSLGDGIGMTIDYVRVYADRRSVVKPTPSAGKAGKKSVRPAGQTRSPQKKHRRRG